jgi:inorganic triphosphatase YgiF
MQEIELKLRVPPDRVARLKRSALLRALTHGRPVARHLRSVYFDTQDRALLRHGAALRVRSIGRRHLQTLKLPTGVSNGLQVFREIEHEVAGEAPDLALLDEETLRAVFPPDAGAPALAPVFETDVLRTVRPVQLFDSAIEVAFDVGSLRAAERETAICEAELELKEGRPARLFELALALHDDVPLALETRTKAERGYALVEDRAPGFVKAGRARLEPDLTAGAAFVELAHNCLDQIRGNHPGVLDGHEPEAVHQMRVGVRRLRALIAAYRAFLTEAAQDFMREELRWLQQALGAARDWHVFADETLRRAAAFLPAEAGLARLMESAQRCESEALEDSRQSLTSPRFTTLLLRFELLLHNGDWTAPAPDGGEPLDRPVGEFAAGLLDEQYQRLRKFGGKDAALDAEEDLHRLRIQAKKMRYLGEFFRSLSSKKAAKDFLSHLAELQEILGTVQDVSVGRERLAALEARSADGEGARNSELARAGGIVTGWLEARKAANLLHLRKTWRSFRRTEPFWKR